MTILNFLLHNNFFDNALTILSLINYVLLIIPELKDMKNEINTISKKDKISVIKIIITMVSFLFLILLLINNELFLIVLLFILPVLYLKKLILNIKNNNTLLTFEDKFEHIGAYLFYIVFLSSFTISAYSNLFPTLSHTSKELLLIVYIIVKIVLLIFLLLVNIFILMSNVKEILIILNFKKPTQNLKNNKKTYKMIDYNFILYKKYNSPLFYIIDIIIYTILSPFTIILNLVVYFYKKACKYIINYLYNILHFLNIISKNNVYITKKITTISIILAFFITYIVIIWADEVFITQKIVPVYEFIVGTILIPIIYDMIKSIKSKKKELQI